MVEIMQDAVEINKRAKTTGVSKEFNHHHGPWRSEDCESAKAVVEGGARFAEGLQSVESS